MLHNREADFSFSFNWTAALYLKGTAGSILLAGGDALVTQIVL
jgi:hypothetical protein